MARLLPVPAELQHLIEKREASERRGRKRRAGLRKRAVDLGPLGSIESAKKLDDVATEERRSVADRRKPKERRVKARRTAAKSRTPKK